MVSAVLTATAPDVGMLLFARCLDGVQGAATGTASMAIILELFAPEDRVKALGWWSLVGAGGPVLGVTLGSPVIQYFGWRTLFWGQLVLLVLASAVVAVLLPTRNRHRNRNRDGDRRSSWEGMDWIGSWTLAGGVTSGMLVLSIGPIVGWRSTGVVIAGVLAVGLGATFVWRELTFATPLVPTVYFRRRNVVFPLATKGFSSFAYFGGFFLFPLLMEQVYGYSISQVGFLSVARPLVFAVSAPIAGYMTVRTGERATTLFGTGVLFVSMVLFATLTLNSGIVVVLIALALSGLGMGVSMPATSSTLSNELDESEYGVMSAAALLAAQVGEVAGIQAVLTIQESLGRQAHHPSGVLHSFSVPFWMGAGAAAVSVVCAFFMRPLARGAPSRAMVADPA